MQRKTGCRTAESLPVRTQALHAQRKTSCGAAESLPEGTQALRVQRKAVTQASLTTAEANPTPETVSIVTVFPVVGY